MNEQRQLAAILFTDLVGYSALMARDEALALECLRRRSAAFEPLLARFGATLHKEIGDGTLSTFASARQAVECALALQESLAADRATCALRAGIHIGEAVFSEGDVHGDGVNIAARLEPLARPGGIVGSEACRQALRSQTGLQFLPLGEKQLKNIPAPVAVYEITRTGAAAGAEPASAPPPAAHAPRPRLPAGALALGGILLLALLAGVLYVGLRGATPEINPPPGPSAAAPGTAAASAERAPHAVAARSIAVLPFVNMSADPANEYFSDGIAEELLNMLAKIPELQVAARTSSFSFKGRALAVREIAAELGVAHVLEGSVRKAGDQVRINAQLVRADTGFRLWSQTYDRRLDDVFAIQDEIAAAVVGELRITLLGGPPQTRRIDPRAYNLFLEAQFHTHRTSPEGLARAIELYRQVVALEPGYAPPWEALARVYQQEATLRLRPAGEAFALAREAATRALAIDPDYALAHTRLGAIALFHDGDFATAARHMQRGLELDPRAPLAIGNTVLLLRSLGRLEDAAGLERRIHGADPLNPRASFARAYLLQARGREREAIERYRVTLELDPAFAGANFQSGLAQLALGDATTALASMESESAPRLRLAGLAIIEQARGNAAAAATALGALQALQAAGKPVALPLAWVFALRGEHDAAFAWLERAITDEEHDPELANLVIAPQLRPLHADPRWEALLRRVGMAPEQLAPIRLVLPPEPPPAGD